MDRSFKNHANFGMNQQNFEINDFAIASKDFGRVTNLPSNLIAATKTLSSCGYGGNESYNVQCRQIRNQCEQLRGDSTSSPIYWKKYGGRESGVMNFTRRFYDARRIKLDGTLHLPVNYL